MTKDEIQTRVDAWLEKRRESGWFHLQAGRCALWEQWNNVSQRYGADSPSTLGVLEHGLIPASGYGQDAHLDCWPGPCGEFRWTLVYRAEPVHLGQCFSVDEDGHPSKAEALVVALEAAP